MSNPHYPKIDEGILKTVRASGRASFGAILIGVRKHTGSGWDQRMVDRRLQALRKRGLIHYQKGTNYGWYPGPENQDAK